MTTHSSAEVKSLQESALEHLWVYLREPSDMAEKGDPTIFVSGKGVHVTDALGNTSIDGMSGLWLKNVGYGRTEIADAAYQQMLKLTYMPLGTTTEPTIRLAEKISQIAPGDMTRSFFTSGGSEAVETALKLARAYFKRVGEPMRTKFISRKGSYHGATMGALALGGSYLNPKVDYEPSTFPSPCPTAASSEAGPLRNAPSSVSTPSKRPSSSRTPTPSRRWWRSPSPVLWAAWSPPTTTGLGSGRSATSTAVCSSPTR